MGVTFIGAMRVQDNNAPIVGTTVSEVNGRRNRQRIVLPSAFRFGHRRTKMDGVRSANTDEERQQAPS